MPPLFLKAKLKKIISSKIWYFIHNAAVLFNLINNYTLKKIFRIIYWKSHKLKLNVLILIAPLRYRLIIKNLRKKEKIKVAFLLIHESVWKYEGLYKLMIQDERFEPIVVVIPYTNYGQETMIKDMDTAYIGFENKGYNVIKSLDENTEKWLDIKKNINPDIVFFTNPHQLTRNEYFITNYLNCLTCYVPYSFLTVHLMEMHYNQTFHNLLWKAFYETDFHKIFAEKYAYNKGKNIVVTGYPGIDDLINKNYIPNDPWKIKDRKIKRIIWAPHHSIDDDKSILSYSNFLKYNQYMLDIAEKYSNKIQIAFKPHPILKNKLYLHEEWGKKRTDNYYNKWQNIINGQLELSGYIDLFLTSDAMIHDSASFMVEYLYTNKPAGFTIRDIDITDRFNEFGKIVFEKLYKLNDETEITKFIDNVILNNQDVMQEVRLNFIKNSLLPPNNETASNNIFNEIKKELELQ